MTSETLRAEAQAVLGTWDQEASDGTPSLASILGNDRGKLIVQEMQQTYDLKLLSDVLCRVAEEAQLLKGRRMRLRNGKQRETIAK